MILQEGANCLAMTNAVIGLVVYIMVEEIIVNILLHAMQYSPIVIFLRIEQFCELLIENPGCLSSL